MQKRLPDEWVERIFMRLHGRFGNAFFDKFRIGQVNDDGEDYGVLNAKEIWAEDCAHLSPERLKKGLAAKFDFAPSCDEFIKACAPVPACHLESPILSLPKPKPDNELAQKNLAKIREMMNIKRIPD